MLMPEDRGDVRTHSSPRVSGYSQEHSKRAKEHGGCLQTPFLRCNKETENNQRAGAAAPPQRPHGHTIADAWSRGRGVRSHRKMKVMSAPVASCAGPSACINTRKLSCACVFAEYL